VERLRVIPSGAPALRSASDVREESLLSLPEGQGFLIRPPAAGTRLRSLGMTRYPNL
jgi:hypothetical protein